MKVLLATEHARTRQMLENAFKAIKRDVTPLTAIDNVDQVESVLDENDVAFVDWEGKPEHCAKLVWTIRRCNPTAPILLLSFKANRNTTRIGLEAGAGYVMEKPVDPDELLKAIAKASAAMKRPSRAKLSLEDLPEKDMIVLRVRGNLDHKAREEFRAGVRDLLASERGKRVIDLSRTEYISSLFFGTLLDLGDQARSSGHPLSVIMTSKVAKIGQQIGLEAVMKVVSV